MAKLTSTFGPVGIKLSVMMFLQFFIWGAWYVTVAQYMLTPNMQLGHSIGWVYTVGPIAAIISPLFLGMIADRFFPSERVLGMLHIIGGLAIMLAPQMAEWSAQNWSTIQAGWETSGLDPAVEAGRYWIIPAHLPFIGIIFLHMLCYMPTLGLTNTLAFHNLEDGERQFPLIRVFGTIGWILAGLTVSWWLGADETGLPLQVAGGAAIVLGIYSFFLPHTPPPMKGRKATVSELLSLDALKLMKNRSFAVFILASLLTCIPLAAYYAFAQNFVNHAGFRAPAGVMTIGQVSEFVFMLLIPLFFARLGVKWMLALGMAAWALRYVMFAMGAPDAVYWMIIVGIALHGICYDFFFVVGFIYTDKVAPPAFRAQAQGFLVLVTQGIGLGLGAQIMQRVFNAQRAENHDALAAQGNALRAEAGQLTEQASRASGAEATALMEQADHAWRQASELLLQTYDWQGFWLVPAVFATAVLVVFILLFREPKGGEQASEGAVVDQGTHAAAVPATAPTDSGMGSV